MAMKVALAYLEVETFDLQQLFSEDTKESPRLHRERL